MKSIQALTAAVATCMLVAAAVLDTASPVFWRVSTQQDFLRGEVEHLSVDADGQLLLGPATDVVYESTAPFLWAVIEDANGALWAGSGNDGKLIRVDRDGAAADVLDTEELEIHAVAAGPDGSVYAASSPDGRIYRVRPDGTSGPFADVDDTYIWALAIDAAGTLFVATGERGRIYRVPPGGAAELIYDTKAAHVLSLAFDAQGRLVATTGSPGRIFRVDPDGRGFVLLESAYTEVRSLRPGPDGALYATALSPTPGGGQPSSQPRQTSESAAAGVPTVSVSTEVTAVVIADQAVPSAPIEGQARPPQGPLRGAVYRIAADGVWDVVWQSNEDLPYDVAFADDGALIVGTGANGKIYRVTTDPPKTILLTKAPAKQTTAVIPAARGGHYVATANPGKILRISNARAREGTYESDVRDARTVATWGTVRWDAITPPGSRVQLFTRSGNTDTPDDTWSPWSRAYVRADGEQIESPKARYLQWRAVLSGTDASPALVSVTAAYLPRNLRPEIASLTVHPPGIVFQQPFSSGDPPIAGLDTVAEARVQGSGAGNGSPASTLGRRAYRKGLQSVVWSARDGNDDDLRYEVLYRREGEATWTSLKRDLIEAIFTWDTTSVPDGVYVLKVVATDAPANSPGTELQGERESRPIDVDNSAPVIEIGAAERDGGSVVLPFTVRDTQTPVQRVEFSLDAERWQVIYPVDGIPDSRTEQFRLRLQTADTGSRVIIRATDRMNNTATASAASQP